MGVVGCGGTTARSVVEDDARIGELHGVLHHGVKQRFDALRLVGARGDGEMGLQNGVGIHEVLQPALHRQGGLCGWAVVVAKEAGALVGDEPVGDARRGGGDAGGI